jgi:hypothetical protein
MTKQTKPVRLADLMVQIRARFSNFQEDDFVDWLESGFRTLHAAVHAGTAQPFGFVSDFVGLRDSILDDLEFIYHELIPTDNQLTFRRSIAKLLMRDVTRATFPEEAVSELIYLIERVGADEALYCLASVVETGRYGADSEWLKYDAISVLKQMLGSEQAVLGLYDMAGSPNFAYRFSFDILGALCRYVPNAWVQHVKVMSGWIGKLSVEAMGSTKRAIEEFNADEKEFVKLFSRTVPPSIVARQLRDLLSAIPHLSEPARGWTKNRFVGELLGKDGPLDAEPMVPDSDSHSEEPEIILKTREGQFVCTCRSSLEHLRVISSVVIASETGWNFDQQFAKILPVNR